MTRKLIIKIMIIGLIVAIIKYVIPLIIYIYNYDAVAFNFFLFWLAAMFMLFVFPEFMSGGYDKFFERHTDPILKKVCDFLNRRNGGCNE